MEARIVISAFDITDGRQGEVHDPVVGLDLDLFAGDAFGLGALDLKGFGSLGLGLFFLLDRGEGTHAGAQVAHGDGIGVDGYKEDPHSPHMERQLSHAGAGIAGEVHRRKAHEEGDHDHQEEGTHHSNQTSLPPLKQYGAKDPAAHDPHTV